MKVLFVCSGNICRSPMAAEWMRHRLADAGLAHVVVESAGTLGIEGAPASEAAIRTLAARGVDLAGHRSRGLRRDDLRTADLVLAMSIEHLTAIERVESRPAGRVHLLRAFETGIDPRDGAPDLEDPIGREDAFYESTFAIVRRCVDHVVRWLRNAGPEA